MNDKAATANKARKGRETQDETTNDGMQMRRWLRALNEALHVVSSIIELNSPTSCELILQTDTKLFYDLSQAITPKVDLSFPRQNGRDCS